MFCGQRPILGLRLCAEPEEVHSSWRRRVARNAMGDADRYQCCLAESGHRTPVLEMSGYATARA
jgi:hypothetical protein